VTPFVASQDLVLRMFSNLNKVHIFSAKNHFHLLIVWSKNDVRKDPKSCCSKTWINYFSCIEITWMILKCKNIKLQRIYNSAVSENCCHAGFLQFHWAVDTWSCVGILRALVDLNFEPSGFLLMLLHFNSASLVVLLALINFSDSCFKSSWKKTRFQLWKIEECFIGLLWSHDPSHEFNR